MPEQHPRRRGRAFLLSDAHDQGRIVTVRCMNCFETRHYLPSDLKTVLGEVDCDVLDEYMKCEQCGRGDCIRAEAVSPSAQERQTIRLRRLVSVKLKKVPVWREE